MLAGQGEAVGVFVLGLQTEISLSMQAQTAVLRTSHYPVCLVATVPIMSKNTVLTLLF